MLIISGLVAKIDVPGEEPRYMVGAESKECVSDLQRYLRRDDPMEMAAHRALGQWRVVQTFLVPLLRTCRDADAKLTFNVLKVIVKLTMKPEQLASRIIEHCKEKKLPEVKHGTHIDELVRYHRAYKRAFLRGDAMGNLVYLLGRALSVPEDVRSEEESMLIELLLALMLNLLHTAHPDAPPPEAGRTSDSVADKETLRALVACLQQEHGLETLLYVLQQVEESPTFRSFNLTLLEMTHYILSAHPAEELYEARDAPPPKPGRGAAGGGQEGPEGDRPHAEGSRDGADEAGGMQAGGMEATPAAAGDDPDRGESEMEADTGLAAAARAFRSLEDLGEGEELDGDAGETAGARATAAEEEMAAGGTSTTPVPGKSGAPGAVGRVRRWRIVGASVARRLGRHLTFRRYCASSPCVFPSRMLRRVASVLLALSS